MRIAIVGSGISGLVCAWLLSREHSVTLFEANDYLGGHTHTHELEQDGRRYSVDSGFIVYNPRHYPLLTRLFAELRVASQPSTMSFSVRSETSGLEYNASSLNTLFCQRRNLVSPRFLAMCRDLLRFYREAPALLDGGGEGPTLGDYLTEHGYGDALRDEHLIPMASALWSCPPAQILAFPARYLVQFMANHQMLQVSGRPEWRVVSGGSASYISALRASWKARVRLNCPVRDIRRDTRGVTLTADAGSERFDHVILGCHSDQALAVLGDASDRERDILSAIPYQPNTAVLHTDATLLPRRRTAWAAWNAFIPHDADAPCTVSYCMNLLQGFDSREPFIVTLNRQDAIDPRRVLRRMRYHHPVYTHAAVSAQRRRAEIQGVRRTWFAGAYWGWGFHEDGMRSAVEVARAFRVDWASAGIPAAAPAAGKAA